uniref:ZFP64 zinc finger protein n=1 Tax=Ornithorhynchus anatinus TaxID=9258 RepID=A0A6I8PFM0_ORNAN
MNANGGGEGFPGSVQFPGGTTVLVELTPDIHICGLCKQQFNNLDAFVAHKQSGCQLSGATPGTPGTVQFVAEETVPAPPSQTAARTITSETQTITVSAPEFVFEHGYQTYLPTESSDTQTATVVSVPPKARSRKAAAALAQKKLSCCYPGDRPHKCDVCGKCFSRKDKLKMHVRSHTGVKPYKCKHCDYAAADGSSLNKHRRIHSNERPFKCQICPYASRNSSQLTVHLRSHTGDAPFQCQMCSSKFKINSDLKRHLRVHSGEKPYKCEFCDVRCAMKGNLKSHIRLKHGSENTFECPECDFRCGNKTSLRHHARVHQPEQPVKCSRCSYSCSNKAALKVHERIHCEDRPFKCEFCSFDTKQRSNLTTHVKKAHGDRGEPKRRSPEKKGGAAGGGGDRPPPAGSRQVARLDAKKAFRCDFCEASFVREDSLRSHRKQHGEYSGPRSTELAVLQLRVEPGGQADAPFTVGHVQVPLRPSQLSQLGEGSGVKIVVGHQAPQGDTIVRAASLNVAPPALAAPTREDLPAADRLQILRQAGLVAPPRPRNDAGAAGRSAVLLTAHDRPDGAALHRALISAPPGGSHQSSASQTFITGSGISCSDLEGLNALIQEGTTEVTVVSDGSQDITVSTTTPPPIFSSSSHQELPKQTYSIIQSGAHSALLCPADSIPD